MNIQVTLTGTELVELVRNGIIAITEARDFLGLQTNLVPVDIAEQLHDHDHEHNHVHD